MKRLRLGLIGLGSMGQNYLRVIPTLVGATLSAVADLDKGRAESAGKSFGAKYFTDYKLLLPEVDAVLIVAPTAAHYAIAKDALSANLHVLLEKPLTGSAKLFSDLTALAGEKKLLLASGLIERFNPAFQKISRLIRGEKILGLDLKRLSPLPERITDTDVIFDMMLHDLDLLLQLTNEPIESIKAEAAKEKTPNFDRALATVYYGNGLISHVEASRIFGSKIRNISITTERNYFEADLLNKKAYERPTLSAIPSAVTVKKANQLGLQLQNFVAAIKGKGPLVVQPQEALAALSLAERIKKLC